MLCPLNNKSAVFLLFHFAHELLSMAGIILTLTHLPQVKELRHIRRARTVRCGAVVLWQLRN
jgi:hypothetical protein